MAHSKFCFILSFLYCFVLISVQEVVATTATEEDPTSNLTSKGTDFVFGIFNPQTNANQNVGVTIFLSNSNDAPARVSIVSKDLNHHEHVTVEGKSVYKVVLEWFLA